MADEITDFNPDWYSPTGVTVKCILRERKISVEQFAVDMGCSVEWANGLIAGTEVVTEYVAERLETVLGSTQQFWIKRDQTYWRDKARIDAKRLKKSE